MPLTTLQSLQEVRPIIIPITSEEDTATLLKKENNVFVDEPSKKNTLTMSNCMVNTSFFNQIGCTRAWITGVVESDGYCAYMIHIDTCETQFSICRRYSEFRSLRRSLIQGSKKKKNPIIGRPHCGFGPCRHYHHVEDFNFPRRRVLQLGKELQTAQDRTHQLQIFLDIVLNAYRNAAPRMIAKCEHFQCGALRTLSFFLEFDQVENKPHRMLNTTKTSQSSAKTRKEMVSSHTSVLNQHRSLFTIAEDMEIAHLCA